MSANKQLIQSIKTECGNAILEELYTRIFPKVKAYIRNHSGSSDDAFDIFQDAVVILCRYIRTGRYDEDKDVDGFLFTICRNLWINKAKRDKKQIIQTEGIEIADPYDFTNDILTPEKERYLQCIIQKLGNKCFKLLQYSVYHHKTNSEICQLMKFATENSVKTQKYKCKQKLMEIMEAHPALQEVLD